MYKAMFLIMCFFIADNVLSGNYPTIVRIDPCRHHTDIFLSNQQSFRIYDKKVASWKLGDQIRANYHITLVKDSINFKIVYNKNARTQLLGQELTAPVEPDTGDIEQKPDHSTHTDKPAVSSPEGNQLSDSNTLSFDKIFSSEVQRELGINMLTEKEKKALLVRIRNLMLKSFLLGAGRKEKEINFDHYLLKKIKKGAILLLDNHSVWQIASADIKKTSKWHLLINVIVVDSDNGPEGCKFMLINAESGDYVHARCINKK